ncbi:hypothetical protein BDN67DRAFT_974419 [Paxillus ammoniavirescens]|nr:hypothetical protein BDN67DRAFT_974419 [Paxillus ammoniavirescens]
MSWSLPSNPHQVELLILGIVTPVHVTLCQYFLRKGTLDGTYTMEIARGVSLGLSRMLPDARISDHRTVFKAFASR